MSKLTIDISESQRRGRDLQTIERVVSQVERLYMQKIISESQRDDIETFMLYFEKIILDLRDTGHDDHSTDLVIETINTGLRNAFSRFEESNNYDELTGYLDGIVSYIKDREEIRMLKYESRVNFLREWEIDLYISTYPNHRCYHIMYLFLELFSSIEDSVTNVHYIELGSLKSKIMTFFRSPEAKKIATETLSATQDKVHGYLQKERFENEKNSSESEKLKAEAENIKFSTDIEKSEQASHSRELDLKIKEQDLRHKELENHQFELQNEKLSIENFKSKMELLAELLAKEIINSEQFKLAINGKLVIEKDGALINLIPLSA